MAIPDYQSCMFPLLEFLGDQNEQHSLRETIDHLAAQFKLTEDEQKQLLPSGQQAVFDNRVAWARTPLCQGSCHLGGEAVAYGEIRRHLYQGLRDVGGFEEGS